MQTNTTRLFPILAILGAIFAYLFPHFLTSLSYLIVPLLVIIMLSMGLTLTIGDFKHAFAQKTAVLLGLILQYSVMPLGALGVSMMLGLNKELMVGMVLVGSVAGGTASNVMNYLAKGDVALSITMTALSTLVGYC